MNPAYDLLQQQAQVNKQLYTVLRFACRCDHVTALVMNTYESATVFIAAKVNTARVYTVGKMEDTIVESFKNMAKDAGINFNIDNLGDRELEETDLLYINTPAEGNYRAMELTKYSSKVRKYIILPNTVAHAHIPSNNIKMADNSQAIGLVFGINHFLQTYDNWFIMEHDDLDPGMTVLVNKDNVQC